jgi:hypothetical protein
VSLVLVLGGCDFVFGLKEEQPQIPEAGVDAAIDAVDAAPCVPMGFAGDSFAGNVLAPHWMFGGTLTFNQDNGLHFQLAMSQGFLSAELRSRDDVAGDPDTGTVERTDHVAIALAQAPTVSNTNTAFMLYDAAGPTSPTYKIEIRLNTTVSPNVAIVMSDVSEQPTVLTYSAADHRFFKIHHEGPDVVYSTSADGNTFVPRRKVIGSNAKRFHVALSGTVVTAPQASIASWRDLRVTCP